MHCLAWFFILAIWLTSSEGFEFCIQDDNPLRCGIPPLTNEQIENIDTNRLRDIRDMLIERDGTPLALEETLPTQVLFPLVELTPIQRAALDRKLGPSSDEGMAQRRKRGASEDACSSSGFQTVIFALTVGGHVCQIDARVYTNLNCNTNGGSCSCCCTDDVIVPLTCVNVDTTAIGQENVILKRCTCCKGSC